MATLVFYSTVARPGYAQVLLYCTVALAAARYAPRRAMGITSLVALLLIFAALLPLHVAPPALASEIVGLYALTYLVGLLSEAEKAIAAVARENAQLAHTVLQRNRELSALNGLIQSLNAETEPQRILELGLAGVVDALRFSAARAYVPGRGGFRLAHALPLEGGDGEHEAVAARRRHEAMRAATGGQTVVKGWHSGIHDGERLMPGPLHVSVPVMLGGGVGAVIQVDVAPQPTAMTEAVLETLEVFCGELSIALENARLRGEAQRSEILQEKNRIAQELHDTVLQMLFTVGLRLQWSMEHLPAESPVHAALAEARHLSARAGGELRGAIFTLCSDIAEIGLVTAVERLVEEQAQRAGWSARVLTSGEAPPLPILVQNAAHRVAREALMNAYKHAGASEVMVALHFTAEAVTVVVQDDGRGISDEALREFRHAQDHFGLRTVAEQVEGLGGQFSLYNNDEEGAAVKAVIPVAMSVRRAA